MPKIIIIILWLTVIAAVAGGLPVSFETPLKIIGVLLVVAHLAEYFIFKQKITAKGDGTAKSFLMTMVFGVIYIKGI